MGLSPTRTKAGHLKGDPSSWVDGDGSKATTRPISGEDLVLDGPRQSKHEPQPKPGRVFLVQGCPPCVTQVVCLSVCLPIYLSTAYLPIFLSTYLPTCLPAYLSTYLPIYLSINLFIHVVCLLCLSNPSILNVSFYMFIYQTLQK